MGTTQTNYNIGTKVEILLKTETTRTILQGVIVRIDLMVYIDEEDSYNFLVFVPLTNKTYWLSRSAILKTKWDMEMKSIKVNKPKQLLALEHPVKIEKEWERTLMGNPKYDNTKIIGMTYTTHMVDPNDSTLPDDITIKKIEWYELEDTNYYYDKTEFIYK